MNIHMPRKRVTCPKCSRPMTPKAKACRRCVPSYVRSPEQRRAMSALLSGVPRPHQLGRKRPDHAATMREWWTEERRETKRQEMLLRNPNSRYHGLSAKQAARIVRAVGCCQRCGGDGLASRLGVHHHNRDKHDQSPENLEVLCHRCHMREHADHQETGWDSYHRKRRTTPD